MIEINNINSDYFERAYLIVKDNTANLKNLELEAKRVVDSYFPEYTMTKKSSYLRSQQKKKRIIVLSLTVFIVAIILVLVHKYVIL